MRKSSKNSVKAGPIDQELINSRSSKNIVIPDRDVLIQDPGSIKEFLKGGNLVIIPWQVFLELDNLKKSSEVGWEAGKLIKNIHSLKIAKTNLVIERRAYFPSSDLDKSIPNHRIIATALYVAKNISTHNSQYYGYGKVKLITNDYGMQVTAMEVVNNFKLSVEFYRQDMTKLKKDSLKIIVKNLPYEEIHKDSQGNKSQAEYYQLSTGSRLSHSAPVLVRVKSDKSWHDYNIARRKGNRLIMLNDNISAASVYPKHNGSQNWAQIAALHLLLDDSVPAVFLQGPSGTGKTLLALAAGIHQKRQKKYEHLIVMRPTVYLSDDYDLGFLPGDLNQKLAPWLLSIKHNLEVINKKKKNEKVEENDEYGLIAMSKAGVEIQSLAYIRGASFQNCYMIFEEAQNLPVSVIKSILTRPAKGTKMIFTGDLGQIDNKRLTKESSGLTHAIIRMGNDPMIGVVNFEQTLRSPLASLAEKLL